VKPTHPPAGVNISLRLGREPKLERVLGGGAANQMLSRSMRKPWAIHLS